MSSERAGLNNEQSILAFTLSSLVATPFFKLCFDQPNIFPVNEYVFITYTRVWIGQEDSFKGHSYRRPHSILIQAL